MYISGAPQCPMPDAFLNDAMVNSYFDFYFVQFFNNYCGMDQWSVTETTNFNFDAWDSFAKTVSYNTDVRVYLGVAASSTAAGTGYVTIDTLNEAAAQLMSTYSSFGGIMMWYVILLMPCSSNFCLYVFRDASQAYNNIPRDGLNYAQLAKASLVSAANAEASALSTSDISTQADYSSLMSWTTIADNLSLTITEATVTNSATASASDESGWSSGEETTAWVIGTASSLSAQATVITISSVTMSSSVQTLIIGETTDSSIESFTGLVSPTATYPVVSVSPSASEPASSATTLDGGVVTQTVSYTSTVYNSAFSTPVEVIFFSTITSTAVQAKLTSSTIGSTTSSVGEATSPWQSPSLGETSTSAEVLISSTAYVGSSDAISAETSQTFTSVETVQPTAKSSDSPTESNTGVLTTSTTVESVSSTAESQSEWSSGTYAAGASSSEYTAIERTVSNAAPTTSVFTVVPAPSRTDSDEKTTTMSNTVGTSAYTVIDSASASSTSLTFVTNPPWSATVSLSSSGASATGPSEVSSCPIDGAPCAVHGELACNGYYWGQCVWGTWAVRQCYTGLMCKTDASYVYCDYPGADTVTSCSASAPPDLTRRSVPVVAPPPRRNPHMHARRNPFHSPFYNHEIGKKYFPHVPVKRQVDPDSIAVIKDAVDVLPLSRYPNTTLASTSAASTETVVNDLKATGTITYSTTVPTPTVIQQIQFSGAQGYVSSTVTAYSAPATATATISAMASSSGLDGIAVDDAAAAYIVGISTQRLNSTNFVGTLYSAPRTNRPIGRSWNFVFSSSDTIDRVSRGQLTSLGDGRYQVSSIETEEASSYMAIRLTFWGTYAGSGVSV
ncbi:hypothetical protein V1519DRAFT_440945 [Lipomyces tetrasporus]